MAHDFGASEHEDGVTGTSDSATGVRGVSRTWAGVRGESNDQAGTVGVSQNFVGVWAESAGAGQAGLYGLSAHGPGVVGESRDPGQAGIWGRGTAWNGLLGTSVDQAGVAGTSEKFVGIWAESHGPGQAGLFGVSDHGPGVVGESRDPNQAAVWGRGTAWQGVLGTSADQAGVVGTSEKFVAVWCETHTDQHAALFAKGPRLAGYFEGDVVVTGDLVLSGADYAEALDAVDADVAPGTVVVVGDDGRVRPCDADYDTAVAGIVSGAGGLKPAVVLDRHPDSLTIAMMGKVWCLADADRAPIRPGSLLTTSSTPGHARGVAEPQRAFGAVIGKALTRLDSGRGLVRVLVSPR
jgi:hypothetical protein